MKDTYVFWTKEWYPLRQAVRCSREQLTACQATLQQQCQHHLEGTRTAMGQAADQVAKGYGAFGSCILSQKNNSPIAFPLFSMTLVATGTYGFTRLIRSRSPKATTLLLTGLVGMNLYPEHFARLVFTPLATLREVGERVVASLTNDPSS
eukprot:NODE_6387_length_541_cov_34.398551_g6222_i0.p2 GENE.NODE_6387_length_541_cov_34.398551_g6222_i0~~NODE_6387_length_541_cov_34.398551_g6222_i0.p2  ORF type:complete len:150 (+),score=46.23 NODE_6387_length_541_cov_34.398551_g6222_i0:65-514(+)